MPSRVISLTAGRSPVGSDDIGEGREEGYLLMKQAGTVSDIQLTWRDSEHQNNYKHKGGIVSCE